MEPAEVLRQEPAWIDGLSLVTLDEASALVGCVLPPRA